MRHILMKCKLLESFSILKKKRQKASGQSIQILTSLITFAN